MSAIHDFHQETSETRDLVARIRSLCGDDEQAFVDTLDGETEVIEAARRVVRWLLEQEAHAESVKGLASTYQARSKVFEDRVSGARNALFHFLQQLGLPSMPLPEATLSVRAGTVSLTGEADPADLPDDLVRIKREPNRTAIKAALEAGRDVPGYALSNAAPSLSVRVR